MFKEINFNDPPKLAAIYKWTNLKNGKVYIGETQNLKQRCQGYRSQINNDKRSDIITKALKKHGFDGFKIEVLEFFPFMASKKTLQLRESFWIKFYNSTNKKIGYNICNYGTNSKGVKLYGKRLLSSKKTNLGRKFSQEWKDKIGKANKGKKRTPEQRELMSKVMLGVGHSQTEETKRKISKSHTGKRKPYAAKAVYQIDKNTNEILNKFYSTQEASRHMTNGKDSANITSVLMGRTKLAYGYKWCYADKL